MARRHITTVLLGLLGVLGVGCGGEVKLPPAPPRPVTWFELQEIDPGTLARHTGSVESWKKELVGFEVGGRVSHVLEPGINIDGRIRDLSGRVVSEGEVVAELETERFRIAKEQTEANPR